MLDAVEHADADGADPLIDQILNDLKLVDRIGVDRARIDEFDAESVRGLLPARLHGIEVGGCRRSAARRRQSRFRLQRPAAPLPEGPHPPGVPVHLFIGMLLQCWGNRRAIVVSGHGFQRPRVGNGHR